MILKLKSTLRKLVLKKRKNKQKPQRIYHLQNKEDVYMIRLKKKVTSLKTSKYMGISSMYSLKCELNLKIGKEYYRRIPCVYFTYLETLKSH